MRRVRTDARTPATLTLAALAGLTNIVVILAAVILANTVAVLAAVALAPATPDLDPLAALGSIIPPFVSENFDELVKAATATCEALPPKLLFKRTFPLKEPQAQLVEFSATRRRSYRVRSAHRTLRLRDAIVLYVPGWWNTPGDVSSRTIVSALMTHHPSVLLLDTRLSFCRGYVSAVSNIVPLSYLLYGFIKNIQNAGYNVSSIHIIGFSLGAHVAGMTGKLVRKKLNATLGRITALDPAKPCFSHSTDYKLSKDDAQFVQVIHSSAGLLGLEEPLGHADVYLNGLLGKHPECRNKSLRLQCDHAQAWKLYSESVRNEKLLMGRQCDSWQELLHNDCSGEETPLGYPCSTDTKGMFLYTSMETKQRKLQQKGLNLFNLFDLLS